MDSYLCKRESKREAGENVSNQIDPRRSKEAAVPFRASSILEGEGGGGGGRRRIRGGLERSGGLKVKKKRSTNPDT